ncbi:MAG: YkgB family protein [Hyphomonadaceae bacterium]|nr:YkgB family protein [Hyphomonadaceae bacterium]
MSTSNAVLAGQSAEDLDALSAKVTGLGRHAVRFSIAGVLGWIGAMKFTAYEAGAIEGLVASSPFTSWLYSVTSVQGASNLIGSIEILTALALVAGLKFARVGLLGALAAAFTFLLTFSFLFTAPGWEQSLGGFPALSVVPGQFLLKDAVLFAGALFLAGNELKRIADEA